MTRQKRREWLSWVDIAMITHVSWFEEMQVEGAELPSHWSLHLVVVWDQ
jgi:hypothetical protein